MAPGDDESDHPDFTNETRMMSLADLGGDELPAPAGTIRVDPLPKGLRAQVEITQGARRGSIFTIRKPLVMLGRVQDVVDIVILDDAASRHHAAIGYRDGGFVLYDMGSTNGTVVEGKRVSSCPLSHGSQFQIGETVLTFWQD